MRLITNPNEFFARLKEQEISLKVPVLIVVALAIITSVKQFLIISKMAQSLPPEMSKFFMIGAYTGVIGSFIGMFAIWLIFAAIMHALSSFLGGDGSFRRTFEFTGYGYLPSLIGSLITVSLSSYYVLHASVPNVDLSNVNPEAMRSVMLSIMPHELIYTNLMINLAVTLWSLTIWIFAVKYARNLTTKNAFVTALIPTLLFALYQIYSAVKLL